MEVSEKELLKIINNTPIFQDIEKRKTDSDTAIIEKLSVMIKDDECRNMIINMGYQSRQLYMICGFIKGVNHRIIIGNKQIQITDINTGEVIV